MKKVILVLVLAMMAFTAKAQLYVGGGLSFIGNGAGASFTIAPEVGYNINDNMAVGGSIGFGLDAEELTLSVDPYFRFYFAEIGPVRFFGDAHFNYTFNHITEPGEPVMNVSTWGIGVRPGLAVNLTDNWSIVAHVASLGYYGGKFGFTLNTGCTLGVYYCF